MKTRRTFKKHVVFLAFFMLVFNNGYAAILSLASDNKVHVSNSTFLLGVEYYSVGLTNHAIQFILSFSANIAPSTPLAGYALLANDATAYSISSSLISANSMKIVIIPERMTSTHISPLNNGRLIQLPFLVKALPDGIQSTAFVSINGGADLVISNDQGVSAGTITASSTVSISLSSYLTCDGLNDRSYYVADSRFLDGTNITSLNLSLESLAMVDVNKDGVCDQAAIDKGKDSDNDKISDFDELAYGLNPYDLSDANRDFDGDGLTNVYEIVTAKSDPNRYNKPDTDQDGMDDLFELSYGLNPDNAADKNTDLDNDGLNNYLEYISGSAIDEKDTDRDGMNDGFEYTYGFPFVEIGTDSTSNGQTCTTPESRLNNGTGPSNDKDCDGLTNQIEYNLQSNPLSTDTDKDNVADLAEYNGGRSVTVNEPVLMVIINSLLLQ